MSDQPPKRAGNPGWTKGMASPNPHGRPRSGTALTEMIRAKVPAEALIAVAGSIIASSTSSDRDKLAAAQFLAAYAYQKPVEVHEVRAGSLQDDADDADAECM